MAIDPNVLENITVPNEETDLYQINDANQNISNQSIDFPSPALTFKNNIAPKKNNDSAEPVKNFFDRYFVEPISLPAGDVDAVIGFFEKSSRHEKIHKILYIKYQSQLILFSPRGDRFQILKSSLVW